MILRIRFNFLPAVSLFSYAGYSDTLSEKLPFHLFGTTFPVTEKQFMDYRTLFRVVCRVYTSYDLVSTNGRQWCRVFADKHALLPFPAFCRIRRPSL